MANLSLTLEPSQSAHLVWAHGCVMRESCLGGDSSYAMVVACLEGGKGEDTDDAIQRMNVAPI